jgi:hypothetical protein
MAKSLKDQLKEAGFRSTKMENERDSGKGRERKQAEKHQTTRNFCEHCNLVQPDVERYKHRMPTTEAEWICLNCADKLMIEDRFRFSQQSDVSKNGMFRRYFGATKDFSKDTPQGQRPKDGQKNNKNDSRNKNPAKPKGPRNFNK